MSGLIANELLKAGWIPTAPAEAALPMPVWAVDLEIERARDVSAAELTVLCVVEGGVGEPAVLAQLLGMGADLRLAERTLIKLLAGGAIDRMGEGFRLTETGRAWRDDRSALGRERVTFEVRLDPINNALEWVNYERPIYSAAETWTIDLPPFGDDDLLRRKPELARLVRERGLPDDTDKPKRDQRPQVELRAFCILSRRTHWRRARLDFFEHPADGDRKLVASVGEAEDPVLTKMIERYPVSYDRKRLHPPA